MKMKKNQSLVQRWVELNIQLKNNPDSKLDKVHNKLVSDCKSFFKPYKNARNVRLPYKQWKAYHDMYKVCKQGYATYKGLCK